MLRYFDGLAFFNVSANFLGATLDDKGAKTANVHIFASCHGRFDFLE